MLKHGGSSTMVGGAVNAGWVWVGPGKFLPSKCKRSCDSLSCALLAFYMGQGTTCFARVILLIILSST